MSDAAGYDDRTPCTGLPPVRPTRGTDDATPSTALPPIASPHPDNPRRPHDGVRQAAQSASAITPPLSTPADATAALVCGVLSLVLWGMPIVGLVLGIIAIVLGARARAAQRRDPARYLPSGAATAGLVCGIIGTVLSTLSTAAFAFILFVISLIASLVGMAGHHGPPPPPPGGPVL